MDKMMRICGKSKDGRAIPFTLDNDGAVVVRREWETLNTMVFASYVTKTGSFKSTTFDCSDWGFVSLRIQNNGLEDAPTVKFNIYSDRSGANDGSYLKDINGNNIEFIVPPKSVLIITPEDLPALNYMQYLTLKVKLADDSLPDDAQVYINVNVISKR